MTDVKHLKGKRICVAVSGGVDSVCLLHKLKDQAKTVGFSLSAVHIEHGIRGKESKDDLAFVQSLCRKWSVPLKVVVADCPTLAKENGMSLETQAREVRRAAYQSILKNDEADYIATAHHKGDEAETILFRLIRGTSLTGVQGMSEKNGKFLHPLLKESKSEIFSYAKEHGLSWREDRTNFERDATRNKLRLDIIPALEECFQGAAENLVRFAEIAGEDDALLYRMSERLVFTDERENAEDTGYRVVLSDEKPLVRRACLTVLKKLGITRDYTFSSLERACELKRSQTGKKVLFSDGVYAKRRYDAIAFFKEGALDDRGVYEVKLLSRPPKKGKILRIDADKLPKSATVRYFQEGDEFKRFKGGAKPLKKYFIDEKIPQGKRKTIPLIADENGRTVYVVCGVEISDLVAVDENTKNLRYIVLRKKGE